VVVVKDSILAYAVGAALILSPIIIIAWACVCALILL